MPSDQVDTYKKQNLPKTLKDIVFRSVLWIICLPFMPLFLIHMALPVEKQTTYVLKIAIMTGTFLGTIQISTECSQFFLFQHVSCTGSHVWRWTGSINPWIRWIKLCGFWPEHLLCHRWGRCLQCRHGRCWLHFYSSKVSRWLCGLQTSCLLPWVQHECPQLGLRLLVGNGFRVLWRGDNQWCCHAISPGYKPSLKKSKQRSKSIFYHIRQPLITSWSTSACLRRGDAGMWMATL